MRGHPDRRCSEGRLPRKDAPAAIPGPDRLEVREGAALRGPGRLDRDQAGIVSGAGSGRRGTSHQGDAAGGAQEGPHATGPGARLDLRRFDESWRRPRKRRNRSASAAGADRGRKDFAVKRVKSLFIGTVCAGLLAWTICEFNYRFRTPYPVRAFQTHRAAFEALVAGIEDGSWPLRDDGQGYELSREFGARTFATSDGTTDASGSTLQPVQFGRRTSSSIRPAAGQGCRASIFRH